MPYHETSGLQTQKSHTDFAAATLRHTFIGESSKKLRHATGAVLRIPAMVGLTCGAQANHSGVKLAVSDTPLSVAADVMTGARLCIVSRPPDHKSIAIGAMPTSISA